MANSVDAPNCPYWYGYTCWSATSTMHSSCTVEVEPIETCEGYTVDCEACGVAISDPTPRTWPGRPSYTTIVQRSHSKYSIARWDKTKYTAQMSVIPQGGTLYKIFLEIVYYHAIRFTLSSCVQYVYAIATIASCPDYTTNLGIPYDDTASCTLGSWVGYSAITLPAHLDPFENDETAVCTVIGTVFPFSEEVQHPCPDFSLTEHDVDVTPIATCVCCDYNGIGTWTSPSTVVRTAYTGEVCNSDLLSIYCDPTGGAGACLDEGYLVVQTLNYESEQIECTELCGVSIPLSRIPLDGEADPPEDIPAGTLERDNCIFTDCTFNQDRPLIAKPATINVTLPCA